VNTIMGYEKALLRTYFHNQPLDAVQLQAWRDYLDFETKRVEPNTEGTRVTMLFERCLVAANNYLEFWLRYVDVFEQNRQLEGACNLLCESILSGRLHKRLDVVLMWSELEEKRGKIDNARSNLDASLAAFETGNIELMMRRIAIERRTCNLVECGLLLKKFVGGAPDHKCDAFLSQQYARFCEDDLQDPDVARNVYENAWSRGCRDLTFLMEYVAFSVRFPRNRESNLTEQGTKLFEESLDPARTQYTDDEQCTVWRAYVNFLVTYGAPIQQLRKVQSFSRVYFATRRARVYGYRDTSQLKRSAPEPLAIESPKASKTHLAVDHPIENLALLDSTSKGEQNQGHSDASDPIEPMLAAVGV